MKKIFFYCFAVFLLFLKTSVFNSVSFIIDYSFHLTSLISSSPQQWAVIVVAVVTESADLGLVLSKNATNGGEKEAEVERKSEKDVEKRGSTGRKRSAGPAGAGDRFPRLLEIFLKFSQRKSTIAVSEAPVIAAVLEIAKIVIVNDRRRRKRWRKRRSKVKTSWFQSKMLNFQKKSVWNRFKTVLTKRRWWRRWDSEDLIRPKINRWISRTNKKIWELWLSYIFENIQIILWFN